MKKTIGIFAAILLSVLTCGNIHAYDIQADGIYYNIISADKVYVTFNEDNLYSGDIVIPETITFGGIEYTVTGVSYNAFKDCLELTSVTIPKTVDTIGDSAFANCTALETVNIFNDNSPLMGKDVFADIVSTAAVLYVPCSAKSDYSSVSQWNDNFFSIEETAELYKINTAVNEDFFGQVQIIQQPTCTDPETIIKAINYAGCEFEQWSDGNTDNPRTIVLTKDTLFTAVFKLKDEYVLLRTEVNDESMGQIINGGVYHKGDVATITAIAYDDYRFRVWNDADTIPIKTITLTKDTTYTAYFIKERFDVVLYPEDTDKVEVFGAGSYECLTSTVIFVKSKYGYEFTSWSDGDTNNPRTIYLDKDYVLSAQYKTKSYNIVATSNNSNKGNVTGGGSYNYKETATLKAVANPHYQFVRWHDNNTDNPRQITVTADAVFIAHFEDRLYNLEVLTSDADMGTVSGSGQYKYFDEAQLVATEKYGYHFVKWSDGVKERTRDFRVTKDESVTAIFDYNTYTATIDVNDDVMGTVNGTDSYKYLDTVTLYPIANEGYKFLQWSDGKKDTARFITITRDTTLVAYFTERDYTVSTPINDTLAGTVQGGGTFAYNTNIVLKAVSNYGYHFVKWSDGDTNTVRSYVVKKDTAFAAIFNPNVYSITVNPNDESMGEAIGSGEYNYLTSVNIKATANDHYHFVKWSDGETDNPRQYTIAGNTSLIAYFAKDTYNINAYASDTTKGFVLNSGYYAYQTMVTLYPVSNYGYHFVSWSDGNKDNPRHFSAEEDFTVYAIFDKNTYSLYATASDTTRGTVFGVGEYTYLDTLPIIAVPNYGYHFVAWNDGDTANPKNVVLTKDTVFSAIFTENNYTLSIFVNDTNMGDVGGSGVYPYLSQNAIVAVEKYGHHFVTWSDGNTQNPRSMRIEKDTTVYAIFDYNTYNISASVNDTAKGSVVGTGDYTYKSQVALKVIPNYGYYFSGWDDGNTDNPREIILTKDTSLVAIFEKGIFTVQVQPNDDEMGVCTGSGEFKYNDQKVISATPQAHHHFLGWSDGNNESPRIVTVLSDTVYIAQFAKDTHKVNVRINQNTMGTVSGSGMFAYSDTDTISAVAQYGYHFVAWNDSDTDSVRYISVVQDTSFEALFDYNQYDITLSVNNTAMGNTNGAGSYNYLSERTIAAIPDYGYHFVNWSDDSTDNPRQVILTKDTVFMAYFTENDYTVSLYSNDTTMGSVIGSNTYKYLTNTTFTAIPNYGYHFVKWSDEDTVNPRNIVITQDSVIYAIFDINQYEIVTVSENDTMGTVNEGGLYNYNATLSMTAVPNYGYHFTQWTDGNIENPRIITVTQDETYTAQFSINSYNLDISANDTMKGNVYGGGTYTYNDTVTVSASTFYGYHFTQWNDGSTDNPRDVVVDKDISLIAQFDENNYTITANTNDEMIGNVTGAGTYKYDTVIYLTAVPSAHCHFVMWNDSITDNPREIAVSQDSVFAAYFEIDTHVLSVTSDDIVMGTVNGEGVYDYGVWQQIEATSEYGYYFVAWNDGNTQNPRTVYLTQDTSFTAYFANNEYEVALSVDNWDMGDVYGAGFYEYLSDVIITAVPNYGYHFVKWSDGITDSMRQITLTKDTTIKASFTFNTYTLTTSVNSTVMGNVTQSGTYNYLTDLTIQATPNTNYHFVKWSDGKTDNPRELTLTRDTSFVAFFEIDKHTVATGINYSDLGTVTDGGVYDYGTIITLEALPVVGSHFVAWSDGVQNNPRNLIVTTDTVLVAMFELDTFVVNLSVNDTNLGKVQGSGVYNYNDEVILYAQPEENSHFVAWSDENTTNPRVITVTQDITLTALFTENDKYIIQVLSDNNTMGTVTGSGEYYIGQEIKIEAVPNENYHFKQWSDGNTDNPRQVIVTDNSTFIANFYGDVYTVNVESADVSKGTVVGGGNYGYGETAEITAIAYDGFVFSQWNDGNTDNPRQITVTNDTTFLANFVIDESVGLTYEANNEFTVSLYPNPVSDKTTLTLNGLNTEAEIVLSDTYGRTIFSQSVSSNQKSLEINTKHLADGVYYLHVRTSGQDIVTKKLIKQ